MSLIRPGQTYARYSNIKPRAYTLVCPVNEKTSSGSRIEDSLNPGSMNPLREMRSSILSIVIMALLRSIVSREIRWNFLGDAVADMEISKFEPIFFYSNNRRLRPFVEYAA